MQMSGEAGRNSGECHGALGLTCSSLVIQFKSVENPDRGALQAREIMQDMLRCLEKQKIQRSSASLGITVSGQSTPSQHEPWHAHSIRIEASILQLPWWSGVFGKLVINKIYLFCCLLKRKCFLGFRKHYGRCHSKLIRQDPTLRKTYNLLRVVT